MLQTLRQEVSRLVPGRKFQVLNQIEISRDRLLENLAEVQREHPKMTIVPVLKGNAYGHGIELVAKILARCDLLAVDGYLEASRIRTVAKSRVLVMGYIRPENVRLLNVKSHSFVVQDMASLQAFASLNRPVRIHLELNTGMNRMGLEPDELDRYLDTLKRYSNLELEGVMTHLADADNARDQAFTTHQQQEFDELVERVIAAGFRPKLVHIAQTAGSVKVESRYANGIRLGIGLYGINPLQPDDIKHGDLVNLRPVLELKSTIVKVLELQPGERVSYNGTFTAPGPMRVGVLPLGYYEGVPRALSNRGSVTFGGRMLPIVGRVCMNHTMIDLGDSGLQAGAEVSVISNDSASQNSVLGLQAEQGLFAYETLTGLSESVRRSVV